VPLGLVDTAAILPMIGSGQVIALGVAEPVRAQSMPNIPTLREAGVPNFSAPSWLALFAPRGNARTFESVEEISTQFLTDIARGSGAWNRKSCRGTGSEIFSGSQKKCLPVERRLEPIERVNPARAVCAITAAILQVVVLYMSSGGVLKRPSRTLEHVELHPLHVDLMRWQLGSRGRS